MTWLSIVGIELSSKTLTSETRLLLFLIPLAWVSFSGEISHTRPKLDDITGYLYTPADLSVDMVSSRDDLIAAVFS